MRLFKVIFNQCVFDKEKRSLFRLLQSFCQWLTDDAILILLRRSKKKDSEYGKHFFSHEWFFLFLFQPRRKRTLEKNCYANFEAAHCLAKRKKKRWEKKSSSSPFENWREQHEICSSFAILKDDEDDDFDVVTSIVIIDFGQEQKIRDALSRISFNLTIFIYKNKKSWILLTKKSQKIPWNFVYIQAKQCTSPFNLTRFFDKK